MTAMEIAQKIAAISARLAVKALKAGLSPLRSNPDWRDTGAWAIARDFELRKTEDSKE
jgi:hypothetical protein